MKKVYMNEATVRAEKLDPLLSTLGYEYNTDMNVLREHQFAYPKISLGRKGKNDPPLIGKPDYICQIRGVATWVLEAKAENIALSDEVSAQAYTYAAHPEIRAIYYCLSDGVTFSVYHTIAPVGKAPILVISLEDLDLAARTLETLLSREALENAAIKQLNPFDPKKVPYKEIISGTATYDQIDYEVDAPQYVKSQVSGEVERQVNLLRNTIYPIEKGQIDFDNNILSVMVELGGHSIEDLAWQKQIGIDKIYFETRATKFSTDPNNPTILQTTQQARLNAGDIMETSRVPRQVVPFPINFIIAIDAFIHREGNQLLGSFRYATETPIAVAGASFKTKLAIQGSLKLNLR